MKYLFIAEKPSAMHEYKCVYERHKNEIQSAVGGEIEFIALAGHVYRNCTPKEYPCWNLQWKELYDAHLPMIPEEWRIAPIKDDIVKRVENGLKGKDGIIVGTDSDVEGYGIYVLLCKALKLQRYKTLRFYETALTEKDILASFLSMEDLYKTPRHLNAINAYLFRSRWDWLLGMNLSVAYTVKHHSLLKIGSVKAPTLKLIYDNCKAIDEFKETTTYGVKSIHNGFDSILTAEGKDKTYPTEQEALDILPKLGGNAVVKEFAKKTQTHKPPALYSLSDLQIDASVKLGFSPDKTLELAQRLYEEWKILTYPRTSGNYLSSGKAKDIPDMLKSIAAIPDIKPFVNAITPADIQAVEKTKAIFNDTEVAKAAHDALIPTGAFVPWSSLSADEQKLFLLVCKRLVAHYMKPFVEERYTLVMDNNGFEFTAKGRKTLENGFNDLYDKTTKDVIIPDYTKGDSVPVNSSEIYKSVSKPEKRYTTGSIIKAMKNIASFVPEKDLKDVMKESEGIGTEATRASILADLEKTGYISVKKNSIYITDSGKYYIDSLRVTNGGNVSYGIAEPSSVAYWAAKTRQIRLGEENPKDVFAEFYRYLDKEIITVKLSKETFSSIVCPVCKGEVVKSKYGYYCKTNKDFNVPFELCGKKFTDKQLDALLSGKSVSGTFKSKAGKPFKATVQVNQQTGKIDFKFD